MKSQQGRPSIYTEELAAKICAVIATDPISTKRLSKKYDFFPDDTTIYAWRHDHASFSRQYDQAKSKQSEILAEEMEDLANEIPTFIDKDGIERVDSGRVAKQKLIIDTRKWMASKLAPKLYGDKREGRAASGR